MSDTSSGNRTGLLRKTRGSLICAAILVGADIVISGSFLWSLFVGPIWLLVVLIKAAIPPAEWRVSVIRITIAAVTLALVVGNARLQSQMARANAELIVNACTRYQTDNGTFPATLEMLVPKYLESVPRAKYALVLGEFFYQEFKADEHTLMYVNLPPFGRPYYKLEAAKWGYID
jgi:hypothetical protein